MGEAKGNPADDAVEGVTEAKGKRVALIIAILALFLAVAESGAKKAEHLSTEENIQASDLFNFYQAKKLRSTIDETAAQALEATASTVADEKAHAAVEKQIADWKAKVANFERYTKNPDDSLGQNSGTRQGGRRISGIIESQVGAFRICQRHLANRDRVRFGGHYYDHADIGVDCGRVGVDRRDIDGVRLSRASSFDHYGLIYIYI